MGKYQLTKLVLASGNQGKLQELQKCLEPLGIELLPQSEFDVPDAEETGLSFVENAILKARHAAKITGLPAIADDSGLEVDALSGAPGIYSARYAQLDGQGEGDEANNKKLLSNLEGTVDYLRTARFHCVIALMVNEQDPCPLISHGSWEGRIVEQPSGKGGFGYDPLFLPDDCDVTVAELSPVTKNVLSHRGQAIAHLIDQLRFS
jgi:XTP/dITP diphosphohydrolase